MSTEYLLSNHDILTVENISKNADKISFLNKAHIFCYDTVDSTNEQGKRLAQKGAVHGTLITAEEQTGGKGRLGRSWHVQKSAGLLFSLILRPQITLQEASRYSLIAAVAVCEGIADAVDLQPMIKWPNDVLLNGKKICGILAEMIPQTDGIDFLVIGIGVNVHQKKEDFSPEMQTKAASLTMFTTKPLQRAVILQAILSKMDVYLQQYQQEGFAPIKEKWLSHCAALGENVSVLSKNTVLQQGKFIGIDDEGALLLESKNGAVTRFVSGEVSLRRPSEQYF